MTLKKKSNRWEQQWKRWAKEYLTRLNILLRAAYTDLRRLTNGDWDRLIDELYFALSATKTERKQPYSAAVKIAVLEALEDLKKRLEVDDDTPEPILRRKLEDVTLVIKRDDERGGFFRWDIDSSDIATYLYFGFADLLQISFVTRHDIRACSNETCNTPFVPLRRPRKDSPAYCSDRCARIVAARNYRANKKKKMKSKKKKPK